MVGNIEAEGAAREGRSASGGKEEDEAVAWSYHDTVLSGKLRQAVRRATDREGGGLSPPGRPMHEKRVASFRGTPGEASGHACTPHGEPHVISLRGV